MNGRCPNCGEIFQWSGKERKYCVNPACRQRIYRLSKRQKAEANLRERWKQLDQSTTEDLEALLKISLHAAQLATHAAEMQRNADCHLRKQE